MCRSILFLYGTLFLICSMYLAVRSWSSYFACFVSSCLRSLLHLFFSGSNDLNRLNFHFVSLFLSSSPAFPQNESPYFCDLFDIDSKCRLLESQKYSAAVGRLPSFTKSDVLKANFNLSDISTQTYQFTLLLWYFLSPLSLSTFTSYISFPFHTDNVAHKLQLL